MVELPYEIWLMIVNYLPIHQVRRLYSINKTFLNIALDVRYNHIALGILPDRVVEETEPRILRNRLLASRPTALQITFYDSDRSGANVVQTTLRSSLKPVLRNVIGNTMGRKPKPVSPAMKVEQLALHVMPRLTRVRELSFVHTKDWDGLDGTFDPEAALVFPEMLRIVGNRLQALRIQSTFAVYLPSRLESLESFSVDALNSFHTPAIHNVMLDKVPAFLRAHQSTIRSVSFSIKNHTLDVSPILQCLQQMTCLHEIDLSLAYGTILMEPFKGGHELLEAHQRHLRSLSLSFVADRGIGWNLPTFFRQEWCSINLPNLRSLSIQTPGAPFTRELGTYIRQLSSSLVSLKIKHAAFSAHVGGRGLQSVCETLSHFPYLQELSLNLSNFNVAHLVVFASTLPHLRSLFLDYSYQPLKLDLFDRRKLSPELFYRWTLESFDYKTRDSENNNWIDEQVAIHLPNVLWIRGKRRNECLNRDLQ